MELAEGAAVPDSLRSAAPRPLGIAARIARRFWALMVLSFGRYRAPKPYDWFTRDEILALRDRTDGNYRRLDDKTWSDIGVDDYLRRCLGALSIVGRQVAVLDLSIAREDGNSYFADLKPLLQDGASLPDAVEKLLFELRCLDSDASAYLFEDKDPPPPWLRYARGIPWIAAATTLLALTPYWQVGLWILAPFLAVNAAIVLSLYPRLSRWHGRRSSLLTVVQVASKLGKNAEGSLRALLEPLAALRNTTSLLAPMLMTGRMFRLSGAPEILNLLTLHEFAQWVKQTEQLSRHREKLRRVYEAVGSFETRVRLLQHLRACKRDIAEAEFASSADGGVHVRRLSHPLVEDALPIDLDVGGAALITGKNGVGKSTLLRALSLNCLLGASFGFCYAAKATFSARRVLSSIDVTDDLDRGISLYKAELGRASAILAEVTRSSEPCLVVFDETFRGTNQLEGTAAAAVVLTAIGERATVIASTHNVILASALKDRFRPGVLVAHGNGMEIVDGVSGDTNGVSLMREFPFPDHLVLAAETELHRLTAQLVAGNIVSAATPAELQRRAGESQTPRAFRADVRLGSACGLVAETPGRAIDGDHEAMQTRR